MNIPVLPEGALVDPYFDRGSFLVPARLGQRGRIRDVIRKFAGTHPNGPLRISITTFWDDPEFFYVIVL